MDKIKPTREEILETINKIIKEDFPCNWEFKEVAEKEKIAVIGVELCRSL